MNSHDRICEIVLISEEPLSSVEGLTQELKNVFADRPIQFKISALDDLRAVPAHFAKTALPHIVILDPANISADTHSAINCLTVASALRELDPGVCSLVVTESHPKATEIMDWLDRGATGLIARNFRAGELSEALREALYRRLHVQLARHPRATIQHKIHMQISSLEQALVAETLNIGFGGLFIRTNPREIRAGDRVEFELEFSKQLATGEVFIQSDPLVSKMEEPAHSLAAGSLRAIRGVGSVVWVRSKGDPLLPEGIGIQFLELDEAALQMIKNFVATHRIRAFIPKA